MYFPIVRGCAKIALYCDPKIQSLDIYDIKKAARRAIAVTPTAAPVVNVFAAPVKVAGADWVEEPPDPDEEPLDPGEEPEDDPPDVEFPMPRVLDWPVKVANISPISTMPPQGAEGTGAQSK